MSIITLTTDFGDGSSYVGAMKGVILTINPSATIVDITHAIPAQDIARAALVLEDASPWFPDDSIHVAVVDPGVGTARSIIFSTIGRQRYVAPDNGLLARLMAKTAPSLIVRLDQPEFWLKPVSSTFHGRDIMAPVAARLSLGLDPRRLGETTGQLLSLEMPQAKFVEQRIRGQIIAIDGFGNLITNIPSDLLAGRPTDARCCVICGIFETVGIYHTYADQSPGMLIALVGSSDRVELALVGDNAALQLGVSVGTPVVVAWD